MGLVKSCQGNCFCSEYHNTWIPERSRNSAWLFPTCTALRFYTVITSLICLPLRAYPLFLMTLLVMTWTWCRSTYTVTSRPNSHILWLSHLRSLVAYQDAMSISAGAE